MIFPKMMAAGKAETVDFKRKEVPEMLREKIRKKLKSEQGTSIFFGLLLFLVASILSVVMLEGAVTTVKTVASDRESEQNQLSCTSAAQVLRDSITNIKLSATVTVKKR